jgi:hypothetical protein
MRGMRRRRCPCRLLKSAGLIIGRAKDRVFATRTKQLLAPRADLAVIALPPPEAREAIYQQLAQPERRYNAPLFLTPRQLRQRCLRLALLYDLAGRCKLA